MVATNGVIGGIGFREGEPAAWLMVRLADWNGFGDVDEFGRCAGLSFKDVRRGFRNAELAALVGVATEAVAAWTPIEVASRKVSLRGETLRMPWDWLHPMPGAPVRACPSCLRADLAESSGDSRMRPFVRAWWCVKDVRHCHVHGTLLAQAGELRLPSAERTTGSFLSGIEDMEAVPVPAADRGADLYMLGRLGLVPRIPVPGLDDLDLGEASSVLSWLGELAVSGTEPLDVRALSPADASRVRTAGLALAMDWPTRIVDRFDELLERRDVRSRGPKAVYGRFYTRLYDDRLAREEHRGRDVLRAVLTEHALGHVPFGAKDSLFGREPVESERVSLAHAAFIAGVPKRRFLRHARSFGLDGQGVHSERTGVERAVAETVRDLLVASVEGDNTIGRA